MRKLVAPDWDAFDDYEHIVAHSNRPARTTREKFRSQVQQQYLRYLQAAPNIGGLTTVVEAEIERRHIRSCYEHRHMADVKERILARQRQADPYLATHCQMCSGMCLADQWDHYLPQQRVPDFAACAYNLIYVCGRCNDLKTDEGVTGTSRAIVHSYYDAIDSHSCYLKAEITLTNGAASVTFEPCMPEDGDEDFFVLYSRHFVALELAERFATYYRIELARIARRIADYCELGLDRETIRTRLRSSAQNEQGGSSSPLAALLRAAADSDEFLEYARPGAQR